MSALIHPKTITVDGLSVRYAEGGQDGPDAILMSPWPESVYAFEPAWPHLAAAAHLVAIDPPGFGGSKATFPRRHFLGVITNPADESAARSASLTSGVSLTDLRQCPRPSY
jgi:pimeloyl-ACP methyl ester carboxylesterase